MSDDGVQEVEYLTTTRLGEKGQLTIPKEYRDSLHLEPGSPMAVMRVGRGLMIFAEHERFRELCERLAQLLHDSGSHDAGLLGGVAAVIANQERIIANQEKILANQDQIQVNQEKIMAK
jgi:AbrB family looped-hinge helix DNA binding protein